MKFYFFESKEIELNKSKIDFKDYTIAKMVSGFFMNE